jgi:SulP family sulfate permease
VGLVQGAGVAAAFPDGHGRSPDVSRDFVGQGAANVASGLLQGMPVGGSMSATALNVNAGARSRRSLLVASVVMAATVLLLGPAVGAVAMPALAGLLMLIGFRTIRPADLASVWRTGPVQKAVVVVTFLLTMVVPLQYAVLAGVGLSVILHIVRQSNQVTIRARVTGAAGDTIEVDPPAELPADAVLLLQPYGSLFFAAAPVFEGLLPRVTSEGTRSVVILRLRGRTDLGTTFIDVLRRYATSLTAAGSKLVLVSTTERIDDQLEATGLTPVIGRENIYTGDERVGSAMQRAQTDALAWVIAQGAPGSAPGPGSASG